MDTTKSKVMKTSKLPKPDTGGKSSGWGPGSAGPQTPGQSAQMGRSSAKFGAGGKGNAMFPKGKAKPATPC